MLRPIPPQVAWQAITALAGLVTLVSALAAPVDLWRLTVQSHQGEPFQAVAAFALLPEEHISTQCLSLGPESDAPGSDLPFLGTANLKLNAERNTVEISTTEPITAPALSLVLQVHCPGAPLYARHFAALIPPAVAKTPAPGAEMTRTKRRGFYLSLRRGDTVEGIAAVLFRGQRAPQQDLVRQVIAGNPNAFPNAINREVPAGTVLWFPDLASVRRSVSSRPPVPSTTSAPMLPPEVRPAKPAKRQPMANAPESALATGRRDEQPGAEECSHLRTRCGLESAPPAVAPAESQEQTRRLEASLIAMRSKCETLESQLRGIEQSVETLRGAVTIAVVPSPPAPPQCPAAALAPKPQIRTVVVTETIPWTVWLGLPTFGMAFAGVLFALWRKGILTSRGAAETIAHPGHQPETGTTVTNVVPRGDSARNAPGPSSYSGPGPTQLRPAPTRTQPASAPVSTERPTPDRIFDKPPADASSTVDIDLGTDSKASRAGLSEDVVREMERAIDGTRSIFTDVDRLIGLDRTQSAISVLEFQIKTTPKDRDCWIKLMAIYRRAGKHVEFDKTAAEFKKNFSDGSAS